MGRTSHSAWFVASDQQWWPLLLLLEQSKPMNRYFSHQEDISLHLPVWEHGTFFSFPHFFGLCLIYLIDRQYIYI